ncbi:MAG: Fur family transcriptional regulator [Dehalococcoidales bacterium]|nr:Fur family transcriptional regulator [Dehalococcoidales bacterium]
MSNKGDILNKLTQQGYRITPQRIMILEAVEDAENHISAEEIYIFVCARYPNVNISTVYRTLELLKELELVTETDFGDGRVRYHSIKKGHHHHLVCQKCGGIIDVDESVFAPLRESLSGKYGFEADIHHLAIFGTCKKCK